MQAPHVAKAPMSTGMKVGLGVGGVVLLGGIVFLVVKVRK